MAYTTIDDPTLFFSATLYTGNGSNDRAVTIDGTGMQPDMIWIKQRSSTEAHVLGDTVRGVNRKLVPNDTDAQSSATSYTNIDAVNSTGFTLSKTGGGVDGAVNQNTATYVSWCWKESATAGFDMVGYTGDGQANRTFNHSLGVTPEHIWFKRTDATNNWINYDKTLGTGHYLTFNLNGTTDSASGAWCTPGSSSVQLNQAFTATNANTATYMAYCFASVQGYLKVGTYKGNGNSDGTFVYTGFRPAFLIYKNTDTADNWFLHDNKRQGYNDQNELLFGDITQAESTVDRIRFCANGFKTLDSDKGVNKSGDDYIYMAIAEQPLVNSNGVPGNAR